MNRRSLDLRFLTFKETYSRVEEEKILFDEKRVRIMYVTYHFKERLRLF